HLNLISDHHTLSLHDALPISAEDKINAEAIASELSVTPSAIDLISDNITLSANQINFDGHVFGHGASFSGDLSSKRVEIGGDNSDRKSTRLNSSHVSISYAVF